MFKQIDKLLIKAFLPPFFLAFVIALFVLVIQTLWMIIDQIVSKGVDLSVILELVGYLSIALFPLAIPIGILISTVLLFGDMAEHYELAAMKSAGMSLFRIMRPLFFVCLILTGISFYCLNNVIPEANLKAKSRMTEIKRQKPTLSLEAGVFNDDFSGFTIHIGKKDEDGEGLEQIKIYDHSKEASGLMQLTMAERGRMFMSEDKQTLILKLYNGYKYDELKSEKDQNQPFVKMHFKENTIPFDMSEFEMDKLDESRYKNRYDMMSAGQLYSAIDTLDNRLLKREQALYDYVLPKVNLKQKRRSTQGSIAPYRQDFAKFSDINLPLIETFEEVDKGKLANRLSINMPRIKTVLDQKEKQLKNSRLIRDRHIYELHLKFARALICLIFLFVGAPMGAIIRKGGYGYSLLISILVFMFYLTMSILYLEAVKAGSMDPVLAAWLPDLIIFPFGMYLTIQAMRDAKLLDLGSIWDRIRTPIQAMVQS